MGTTTRRLIIFLGISFMSMFSFVSHAIGDEAALLGELQPIVMNVLTIVVSSAATIMITMVAYGFWKSSMSLGDPRGLEGAKGVWTYALFGFFVVVLFFVFFSIIASWFGVGSFGGPGGILGQVFSAIEELVTAGSETK